MWLCVHTDVFQDVCLGLAWCCTHVCTDMDMCKDEEGVFREGVAHVCACTPACTPTGIHLGACARVCMLGCPNVCTCTWRCVHMCLCHNRLHVYVCVCVCVQLQAPWCVQGCACTHVCSAGSHSWVLHGAGCCWEAWDLQQPCMQGPHCTDMAVQSAAALLAHMCNALHSPCTVILHQAACAQCISLLRTLTMHCTALA